jgi:Flp pilus assembly protein TadG
MLRRLLHWLAEDGNSEEPRRAPRVVVPEIVVYLWDGSAPSGRGLRDVSLTGAYLLTDERWYPGTIVRLLIQSPPLSASIPARVVRHGPDGMGLEFLFRKPADKDRLAHMIAGRKPLQGQALVEFVLVFPLMFLLMVNAVNFGAFFFAWITVANAARGGAQYWALGSAGVGTPASPTAAQVTSLVTTDISSLLNRASLVVRVCTNNNGTVACSGSGAYTPPADPEASNYILASVDVTYTYQPPIPLFSFPSVGVYATLPPTTVHRRAMMRRLQ